MAMDSLEAEIPCDVRTHRSFDGLVATTLPTMSDVRPTRENIGYIASRLRHRDINEMKDAGFDSREWLWESFERGEIVFVAEYKGEPIAACVVCREAVNSSVLTAKHYISIVGTERIAATGLGGARFSLYNIRKLNAFFPYLFTLVRDDNRIATRFIEALGFKSDGSKTILNGQPATYYERICN